MARSIDIIYFAWVRERLGKDGEKLVLPDEQTTVRLVLDMLRQQGDAYETALGDTDKLRFALDQEYVKLDAPLGEGRELAIFPPVTGG